MPAAAVIPAPSVYTDTAAVKTLVVRPLVQVCWSGPTSLGNVVHPSVGTSVFPWCVGSITPPAVCPASFRDWTERNHAPTNGLLYWKPRWCRNQPSCVASMPRSPVDCVRPLPEDPANWPPLEPSIADPVENSVCSKQPTLIGLNVHPWNVESSTRVANGVVLALGPSLDKLVRWEGFSAHGRRRVWAPSPRPSTHAVPDLRIQSRQWAHPEWKELQRQR